MSSNQIPLVVGRAIAILHKYGYGYELQKYCLELSRQDYEFVRQWLELDEKLVEECKESFCREISKYN